MQLLDRLIPLLIERKHKVLIFSQMTRMLDILDDWCTYRKLKYCRIDGSTPAAERRQRMDEFNNRPDISCFLLSTRAGGLGINLTAADTVIIFDSDWNPHQDLQAQSRCHRIGQSRTVRVFRLITSGTVEMKMVACAAEKLKLEHLVVHRNANARVLQQRGAVPFERMDEAELARLLKWEPTAAKEFGKPLLNMSDDELLQACAFDEK